MPISADIQLDPNKQRFSQPLDSCVGDGGPSPAEVAVLSKGSGPASGAKSFDPRGGSVTAGGGKGRSRAQVLTENWIPPTEAAAGVKVGYDRDDTTDNNYVR